MAEQDIGSMISEWLLQRQENHEGRVEDFVWEKYMESHPEASSESSEKKTLFYERAKAWERNGQAFEKFAGKFQDVPETEPWQSTEMLDNVIAEFEMGPEEQYRYLANVKMLIYYRVIGLLDGETGERLKEILERNYEMEWENARNGIGENDLQKMFTETVSLMKYAGIAYSDETRKILAEVSIGRDAGFGGEVAGEMKRDLHFLTSFLVSEMALPDMEGAFTEEQQKLIAEQVVPVCVSSASMIQEGGDAGHVMKLVQAYLGRLFHNKNGKLLAELAVVFVAAKVVYFLIKLAVAGVVIKAGLGSLWKYCKNRLGLDTDEVNEFSEFFTEWQRNAGGNAEPEWDLPEELEEWELGEEEPEEQLEEWDL